MKYIYNIFFIALSMNAFAQNADKTVTLIVSGQGKTQGEAKQNALRSAIEQAFGTFISSKTQVLNDELITDNISTISNGNIQKFTVLDETTFNFNYYSTTLKVEVSLNKLATFLNQNGKSVTVNGDLITNNYLIKKLYEKNEQEAALNYFNALTTTYSKNLFNIELIAWEPFKDVLSENFLVPIRLKISPNDGIKSLTYSAINFLKQISIDKEDLKSYVQINLPIYPLVILDLNSKNTVLYFRNQSTCFYLQKFYELYKINLNNLSVSNGIRTKNISDFGNLKHMNFPNYVGTTWFDNQPISTSKLFSAFSNGLKSGKSIQYKNLPNSQIGYLDPIYFNQSFFEATKVNIISMNEISVLVRLKLSEFSNYELGGVPHSKIGIINQQELDLFIVDKVSTEDLKKITKYSIINN